ncbi:hypothetical protein P3R38_09435 [Pseudomonas sp. NyZ480]|uniref:hypothetical protein n=1 Tax=Pseudomonas sp. NyZ480 TaxID=3035289 RepID=UPI00240906B7|nr:hypothetical protein [Pseudomonas sp. NyZ480]WEZ90463.1 hypothetical protein P3R38_09435 [Pseudomonas sp. NyZ480]
MSEDDHQVSRDVSKHWAEAVQQMHAHEREKAIQRVEENEKKRAWHLLLCSTLGAFLASDLPVAADDGK